MASRSWLWALMTIGCGDRKLSVVILLTAYIECAPADRETLIEAATTCAVATRKEDGCFEYRFYEDTEQPGKFVFVERWRDQAALDVHFSSPHLAIFQEISDPLLTGRRGMIYEVSGGTEL